MMTSVSRNFLKDEDGAALLFSMYMSVAMLMVAGIAVDVTNAYQTKTHLQVAADSAAHAALVTREFNSVSEAKSVAIEVAQASMPRSRFGEVLISEDIQFGHWDASKVAFTPDANSRDAVLIETAKIAERLNPTRTFFLKLVGLDSWDIRNESVFVTYFPTCFREGFIAEDTVDVTTSNLYTSGFCIHSNAYVELNNGNTFDTGTIVSMPDKRNLSGPSDVYSGNPGLTEALRDGSYKFRIVKRIEDIIAGVQDSSSTYFPDYINTETQVMLDRQAKLDGSQFQNGRIHNIACGSESQSAKIHAGTILQSLVIVTNCKLQFGENVVMEDVVIANTNTLSDSISAASGLQIGRNDDCADGGGAQVVTMGDVKIPQYLKMYNGQILAAGDVSFTSDANGLRGASIVAGGSISGTASGTAAFCGTGMEDNFEAEYFRLAY